MGVTATNAFEPSRDLLTSVQNDRVVAPAGIISKYAYVNDFIGRRASVVMTGEAFTNHGGSHHWQWGYNDRSELTSADRCTGTAPDQACSPMTPDAYAYLYDTIGNRKEASKNAVATYYCTNNLNQYKYTDDAANTCPTPPSPTESFAYDADGNLIADANFYYRWDAENRLIEVEARTLIDETTPLLRFAYDYMSRRIQKRVYGWNPAFEMFELRIDRRFVYDGWNVVLELRGLGDYDPEGFNENDTLRRYAWGLDLSGQRGNPSVSGIHGAGGIGGLYGVEDLTASESRWYLYDANGNVSQVINNTSTCPIVNHYEYDAYGKAIVETGNENPFRFSTKWNDVESGLYYYGYRSYDPSLERWLTRDPIGEGSERNLYGFVANDPITSYDKLGLERCGTCGVEIGEMLSVLNNAIEAMMGARTPWELNKICRGIVSTDGWDIQQLAFEKHLFGTSRCGTGRCSETVQVFGRCYKPHHVNYFLWGKLRRICGADLAPTLAAVSAHRVITETAVYCARETGSGDPDSVRDQIEGRQLWAYLGWKNQLHHDRSFYAKPWAGIQFCCRKCPDKWEGHWNVRFADWRIVVYSGGGYWVESSP